ncbi:hypothetical protein [Dyadobacter arcticus]|uniref:Uncharacterized protein n=1 Tax=Dyadobacter arcticus TaxID=1078754 RepID=A0ABX0UIJ1_9BACT|nr:hypothetical protein [Dyadobacter arcticus]NIJ52751.1 hypothetical protein [Dyadobacter arcticus]
MKQIYLLLFALIYFPDTLAQRLGNKKSEAGPNLEDTVIDSSFVLYTKSICLKPDPNGYSVPCNCSDANLTDSSVIENEYMFLSKSQRKAVVINYIKNRNQRIFTKPKSASRFALDGNVTVQVNIWYLNQLRFGDYDAGKQKITFRINTKESVVDEWNLEFDHGNATIESVAELTDAGEMKLQTEKALFLEPTFYKTNNYILIYQKPYFQTGKETFIYNVLDNTISVNRKTKDVYIKLSTEVSENKQYIHFKGKRVYSYYNE